MRSDVGNMEPLPDIFPDQRALVVRTAADGVRELVRARWVCDTAAALKGEVDYDVTTTSCSFS